MITTTFHISSAKELNEDIIEAIKANYKSKPIKITAKEMDTTEFLMLNPANRAMLEKSIEQDRRGEVIKFTYEEFEKYSHRY